MLKILLLTSCFCLSLVLSGCANTRLPAVFKINIQQGNIVDQAMLDKLVPGMNHEQVEYILGSAVLEDSFHPERWSYIYTLKLGRAYANNEQYREQYITVFFDAAEAYTHYSGDVYQAQLYAPQDDKKLEQRVENRRHDIKKGR